MEYPAQVFTFKFSPNTVKKITKWSIFFLACLALIVILPTIKSVITIVIISLFIAFLLDPLVNLIENRGLDRLWAVVIVFILINSFGVLAFEFLAPVISNEIHQMNAGMKNQAPDEVMMQLYEKLGDKIPILANPVVQEELNNLIGSFLKNSLSMVVNVLTMVVSMIMIAFITFFFLKDGRRMKKAVVSWVPNRYFEMALIILHKVNSQLGRYLRGQLLVASIVGTLSITALYLLNIRYYFFIGAMAGLANMIPYFGPLVGAIPAVIIALIDTGSFSAVVVVAVAFASIQLFENIFVSPFIVSKSVELHPLTIIIVILIGGRLMGVFGMLLAVPVASIIKVTAQELIWGFKNYRIL